MSYYEVVIVDNDSKMKFLVSAKSTTSVEKKVLASYPEAEIVSIKKTKYVDVL